MKRIAWILSVMVVGLTLVPAPCLAQSTQEDVAQAVGLQDYAQRELDARDLEDFEGGHAGVVITIAVIVAIVVLVALILPW